jgi:hypothetical protein
MHEERMNPRSGTIQKVASFDHVTDKGFAVNWATDLINKISNLSLSKIAPREDK